MLFLFLLVLPALSAAQSFSKYIGYSKKDLFKSLGQPEYTNAAGDIFRYLGNERREVNTYMTKGNRVVMAIQGFQGLSLSQAKEKKDEMILFYMSQGYFKQGEQAGLTILKRNQKMVSIGYMTDSDGGYVTLITAYN